MSKIFNVSAKIVGNFRFGIAKINEFYGSTEGNCSVGNISGK